MNMHLYYYPSIDRLDILCNCNHSNEDHEDMHKFLMRVTTLDHYHITNNDNGSSIYHQDIDKQYRPSIDHRDNQSHN